jgi:hypothetical protein
LIQTAAAAGLQRLTLDFAGAGRHGGTGRSGRNRRRNRGRKR